MADRNSTDPDRSLENSWRITGMARSIVTTVIGTTMLGVLHVMGVGNAPPAPSAGTSPAPNSATNGTAKSGNAGREPDPQIDELGKLLLCQIIPDQGGRDLCEQMVTVSSPTTGTSIPVTRPSGGVRPGGR